MGALPHGGGQLLPEGIRQLLTLRGEGVAAVFGGAQVPHADQTLGGLGKLEVIDQRLALQHLIGLIQRDRLPGLPEDVADEHMDFLRGGDAAGTHPFGKQILFHGFVPFSAVIR